MIDIETFLVCFVALVVGVVCLVSFLWANFQCCMIVASGSEVVLERFGNFHKVLGPGIHFFAPFITRPKYIKWSRVEEVRIGRDSRAEKKIYSFCAIPVVEQVHDLPEFRSSTKDRIDVYVNGLVFFKIVDVKKAVYHINDVYSALETLVETAIRDYTSTASLEEVFVSRDKIMARVIHTLDRSEENWGVKVTRFEIQEINCSKQVTAATESAVLKKREATVRLSMVEATRSAKLMEMEAENAVQFAKQKAAEELAIKGAESKRKLAEISNRMLLEATEVEMKQKRMEEEEQNHCLLKRYEAEAEGIQKLLAIPNITEEYLKHRNQLKAWSSMASNPNNKIVLPYNSVPLLGAQSLFSSMANHSVQESIKQE